MIDNWREWLYPLGFLSSLAFGGRFLLQWMSSEIAKKSIVNRSFWHLSLTGNLLLFIHSFIQMQFHVCAIQACNAVISWRNLNLMQPQENQVKRQTVLFLLASAVILTAIAFIAQGLLLGNGVTEWFRIPVTPWQSPSIGSVGYLWHAVGFLGLGLFSSRFWIQWWCAEKYKKSYLGLPFWWISLAGDLMSLVYFLRIQDAVNVVGPLLGLIPYVRNLMLIHNEKHTRELQN